MLQNKKLRELSGFKPFVDLINVLVSTKELFNIRLTKEIVLSQLIRLRISFIKIS